MTQSTHIARRTKIRLLASCLAICAGSMTIASCSQEDPVASITAISTDGVEDLKRQQIELREQLDADPKNHELRMQSGDIAMRLGNYDLAIGEYSRIPDDAAFSGEAKARLAKAYLAKGNMRLAKETLDQTDADSGFANAVRVNYLLAESDMDGALATLNRGLTKSPDSPELLAIYTEMQWQAGQNKAAKETLERGLKKNPDDADLQSIAGRMAMAESQFEKAQEHFMKVLKYRPNDQPVMMALAAIEHDRGNNKAALAWIDRTQQAGPPNPIASYMAAQMAFDAGNVELANTIMQPLRKAGDKVQAIERLDGFIQAQRRQPQSAVESLSRYLKSGIDDPEARLVLATQYINLGKEGEAWNVIKRDMNRPNVSIQSLVLGASLAEGLKQPEAASVKKRLAEVNKRAELNKPMSEAYHAMRAGDWAKADKIYAPLLSGKGANDPVILNNAANVKLELGQNDAALNLANRALALAPDNPTILDTVGWVTFKTGGSKQEARSYIERAYKAAPSDLDIFKHYQQITANDTTA